MILFTKYNWKLCCQNDHATLWVYSILAGAVVTIDMQAGLGFPRLKPALYTGHF